MRSAEAGAVPEPSAYQRPGVRHHTLGPACRPRGLTKSLAKEAIFQLNRAERPAGDGIGVTVNAVTPGFIATDMMATIPDKVLDRIRGQIPVGRLGRPDEIARVVCFLAADQSAYITGQIWAVNGGLDM